MRIALEYERNTYGTKGNPAHYTVRLTRLKNGRQVRLDFTYSRPVAGRGVGAMQGKVKGVSLTFPAKTAEALSGALRLALADIASKTVEFEV